MRDVVRRAAPAVGLDDLVACLARILGDITETDHHDRHLPVRKALHREVSYLRAGLIAEPVAPPQPGRPGQAEVGAEVQP